VAEDSGGGEAVAAKDHTQTTVLDLFEVTVVDEPEIGDCESVLKFWTDECAVQVGAQQLAETRGASPNSLQVGHCKEGAGCTVGEKGRGGHTKVLERDS
jgi:hypothetical protein